MNSGLVHFFAPLNINNTQNFIYNFFFYSQLEIQISYELWGNQRISEITTSQ